MIDDFLTMWVIYDHPTDYPDVWVARRWTVGRRLDDYEPPNVLLTASKLKTLRDKMTQLGLTRFLRDPADDPVIVEIWL